MLPVQELATNLNLSKRELVIPLDSHKFFYVDPENTKVFLDQVLELEETDMKFFNLKQSQPYSNSLDKATIVNNSNATVMQQETFSKTTTGITFTHHHLLLDFMLLFYHIPFIKPPLFRQLHFHKYKRIFKRSISECNYRNTVCWRSW